MAPQRAGLTLPARGAERSDSSASRWAAHGVYPAVMLPALAAGLLLPQLGVGVLASAALASAAGVAAIVGLERCFVHRAEWRADRPELATDVAYLVVVQVLLPVVLGLGLAALLEPLALRSLWPHSAPVWLQFAGVLACTDFAKYWLHRSAHHFPLLWRLHAVHHAPHKLYALNVNRFHPVERALQYAVETAPFALLGVSEAAIGMYLVFHSVHGFFQHANVELRLGPANYLLSGPELHRWHHSVRPEESNANYANHLSLWDVLFGTFFQPRGRQVQELGLNNDCYPQQLLAQLRAPFAAGLDQTPVLLPSWREIALGAVLRLRMAAIALGEWRRLCAAARQPRRAQVRLLRRLLRANRAARFGREHGFADIHTPEAYRARVPVQTYESLRPYVEAEERGGERQLCAEPPLLYAVTSGTTAAPKYIPFGARALARHRRDQQLASYLPYRAIAGAYTGKLLVLGGAAVEGRLPSGTPFGSISGYLYRRLPRLARSRYVLPPEVFDIESCELKYLLIARLALAEPRITTLGAANCSSLLRLLESLRTHSSELLIDLESASFARMDELPEPVRRAIAGRLRCAPARLAELRELLRAGPPSFAALWPHLALLVTWTGGSCGTALASMRRELPPSARVMELGYLASELRGSFGFEPESRLCLPALRSVFLEFVEKERWERGEPVFMLVDELEPGREYHVFVTTEAGLYRYFMNDIVRAGPRFLATPTFEFVQKGSGVTSITGEKLYEGQVLGALRQLEQQSGVAFRAAILLADVDDARYRLLLEADAPREQTPALALCLDTLLCEVNLEYRAKRSSGRLAPLELVPMRAGFGPAYQAACVARGQRDAQFKPLALQYASDFGFDFAAYARHEDAR